MIQEVITISFHEENNAYLAALGVVAESGMPVGAWYLRRALSEQGIGVSEATCGRLLRMMEDAGHVEGVSRKGRIATARGKRLFQEWCDKRKRDLSESAFAESLVVRNPEELIDVLVARRALEGEAAALAADNASPEELGRLREIMRRHESVLEEQGSAANENTDFHIMVAKAGKNPVIVAALMVMYRHPDAMKSLEYIRAKMGSKMAEDHSPVITAIAEGDPPAARSAMIQHIDNVIDDVRAYIQQLGSEEEDTDAGPTQNP